MVLAKFQINLFLRKFGLVKDFNPVAEPLYWLVIYCLTPWVLISFVYGYIIIFTVELNLFRA